MVKTPPELNSDTPQWFKDWRNKEFWHLKEKVYLNNKLTLIILASIIGAAVAIICASFVRCP